MAPKLGKRIARVVTDALRARDRAEMRAMDLLLSVAESPRPQRRRTTAVHQKTERRRVARTSPHAPARKS